MSSNEHPDMSGSGVDFVPCRECDGAGKDDNGVACTRCGGSGEEPWPDEAEDYELQ